MSVSNDLKYDAERDLGDIGASKISVHALNKVTQAPVAGTLRGVVGGVTSEMFGWKILEPSCDAIPQL